MSDIALRSEPATPSELGRRELRVDVLFVLLLLIAAAVVYGRGLTDGGFRWPDGPVHAMDGVLLYDWVRAGPQAWLHAREFALQEYARFPSLGLVGIYPPGLAVVEAVFYAILGVSVETSRVCVVAFGMAAVAGAYVLGRGCGSRTVAVGSGVALLSMPGIVFWTRDTMLETPTLAVLVWACVAAQAYTRKPTRVRLCAAALLAAAAPIFKQTGVFIVPVLGLWALWLWHRKKMSTRHLVLAAALVVVPSAVYWGLALGPVGGGAKFVGCVTTDYGRDMDRFALGRVLYYVLALPELVTWPILALGVIGFVVAAVRRAWFALYLLVYVLTVWVMLTFVIHYKQPRYFCMALLPLAIWTGLAVDEVLARIGGKRVAIAAGLCLAGAGLVGAYRVENPVGPDFVPVIQAHADTFRGQVVLYEGAHDGGFVFAARQVLGPRGAVVVRGSKILYSCATFADTQFKAYVKSEQDVRERLDEYGFTPIVMERENHYGIAEVEYLRGVLGDSRQYTRFATHELAGLLNGEPKQWDVDLFRPVGEVRRRGTKLSLPVQNLGRTLEIDLGELADGLRG